MSENEDLRDHGDDGDDDDDEPVNGHVDFSAPANGSPATPAPKTRRPRRGRPGGPPPGTGAWPDDAPGGKGTRLNAMEIWADLLAELPKQNKTPYDLAVRIVCEDPPPTRPIGNAFDASAIVGDRSTSPSDRLYQMVRDNYHMTWAKVPAIYDVQFVWKDGGKIARRGSLQMPHPDEIIAMKRAEAGGFGGSPGIPQQYGQQPQHTPQQPWQPNPQPWSQHGPQQPWPQPGPQQPWQQPGFGAPQSEETAQLRAELQRERENGARMQGQLTEILSALKEGRAPNATPVAAPAQQTAPAQPQPATPPVDLDGVVFRILDRMGVKPGVGAPATVQPTQPVQPVDQVEATVLRVLGALGVKPGMPGVGVGAPPVTPRTVVEETDAAVNAFEKMLTSVARVRGFGKKLDRIFSEDGAAVAETAAEATAEVVDAKLPFDAMEIPEVKWSDGRPVMYTADKETGKIDWTAAAFSNPAVVEKVADGFSKFMGTIGKIVQAAAKPPTGVGEAEVVDETPVDAKDGGFSGMG